MKRFLIHSMGCKSNQFEGTLISENLVNNGYSEVKNIEDADFYILNSCSVTHKSDNEALYLLRNSKHKNSNIVNILTGCFAQIEKASLLEYDFIDYVVGNDEKLNMAKVIENKVKICVSDIMERREFTYVPVTDTSKTRASLKIQDGCNNRCSYCIIPFARGNSRSAKSDFIIEQINNLVDRGYSEIVFTGIHIGLWGNEFGMTLLDLLKVVEGKTQLKRYRLGSLYPDEITDEMLDFLSKSDKFCPHFHLSLQSLCDKTLVNMNRHYSVEQAMTIIEKINSKFDLPFIGSDIIVGFAGESDYDFNITKSNLEKSGLTQIHTFPYSVRKGTVGETLNSQVDDKVKEKRADIIKSISKEKYYSFIDKNIGQTARVLVEKHPDKHSGFLKGVTDNYLTVILNSKNSNLSNSFVYANMLRHNNGIISAEIKEF